METSTTVEKVDPWQMLITRVGRVEGKSVNEAFATWLKSGPQERNRNEWWRWHAAALLERLMEGDEIDENEMNVLTAVETSVAEIALIAQMQFLRVLQQDPSKLNEALPLLVSIQWSDDKLYNGLSFLLMDKTAFLLDLWLPLKHVCFIAYKNCPAELHLYIASTEIRALLFLAEWQAISDVYRCHGLDEYEGPQTILLISLLLPHYLEVDNALLKGFAAPQMRRNGSALLQLVTTYAQPMKRHDSAILTMAKLLALRFSGASSVLLEGHQAFQNLEQLGTCGRLFHMWFMLSHAKSVGIGAKIEARMSTAIRNAIASNPKIPDALSQLLFNQLLLLTSEASA